MLWALPELRATVEREQWIAAFWAAAAEQQAQQHTTYIMGDPYDTERRKHGVN